MKKFIIKKNFSEIGLFYDIFFFDLFGVTHNGVKLFPDIINILKRIKNLRKKVIFISNAPRKSIKIKKFLDKIGLKRNFKVKYLFSPYIISHKKTVILFWTDYI